MVRETPRGFPPLGGAVDGGHGTQMSMGWDMTVHTHGGGADKCGAGGDRILYRLPLEHSQKVHSDSSYHGIVSISGT